MSLLAAISCLLGRHVRGRLIGHGIVKDAIECARCRRIYRQKIR